MPRIKRNFEATEPTKGLSRFGKVKGMRGQGFFGKAKKECPKRIKILSCLALGLSVIFASSLLGVMLPIWEEFPPAWIGALIPLSFLSVHVVFVTSEMGLGYELKYRNWTMGLVWGTLVGLLLFGIIFAVLSG